MVNPSKVTTYLEKARNMNFSTKISQNLLFLIYTVSHFTMISEHFELVQCVNFEYIDSLEKDKTKYLVVFDDPRKAICISKPFVVLAAAGRNLRLNVLTLSTTCFCKVNVDETLSSKTRTLFSLHLHVTWCKSARLVDIWASDQS